MYSKTRNNPANNGYWVRVREALKKGAELRSHKRPIAVKQSIFAILGTNTEEV
jgi:hypothetical protein